MMARKKTYRKRTRSQKSSQGKTTKYGKAFKKKTSGGKFRKGTLIRYKYVNGRRVGAVKAPSKFKRAWKQSSSDPDARARARSQW